MPALTGIRFFAALMVFFHHIPPFTLENSPLFLTKFINELYVGVTMFFILSGFIITYKYLLKEKFDYREYLWKRFTRIYPLYFLLTIFTFVTTAWYFKDFTSKQFFELLMNLTLLKGFFSNYIFTGIPQAWTLTVEECFYLTSPILAFILFKNIYKRIITLTFSIILIGCVIGYLGQILKLDTLLPSFKFLLNFSFFGRIFEFLLGMILAKFYVQQKKFNVRHCTSIGILGIILSIYVLSLIANSPGTGDNHWIGILINNLILPIVGIAPFYWGLLNEKTWIQNFLSAKPLQILGKSSYAFYLIHVSVFQEFIHIRFSSVILLFIMLYLSSILLYYLVENPLKYFLRTVKF